MIVVVTKNVALFWDKSSLSLHFIFDAFENRLKSRLVPQVIKTWIPHQSPLPIIIEPCINRFVEILKDLVWILLIVTYPRRRRFEGSAMTFAKPLTALAKRRFRDSGMVEMRIACGSKSRPVQRQCFRSLRIRIS